MKTIFLPIITFAMFLNWLGPFSAVAQPVENLQAQITDVESDPRQEEVFRILGTASGQDFSGFRLEFGVGEFPEIWKPVSQSSQPVSHGLLAEWKTAHLASQTYALRLTVKGRSGESLADRAVVKLRAFRPDLAISRVETKVQGAQVSISGTVENRGKHPVRKPLSLDFYLSTNSTLDPSAIHLGSHRLSTMEAGSSLHFEARVMVPAQVKDGSYYLSARIDPKNEVVEADEDNNELIAQGRIPWVPDLVVSELQSAWMKEGRQVSITGKVKNQGNRPAGKAFSLALFLSSDGSIDDRDLRIAVQKMEGLGTDMAAPFNLSASLPETLDPGSYFVLAQVDSEGKIDEWDESNNIYWGSSLTLGPDLTIAALSTNFSKDGQQIVVQDTVKNLGPYSVRQSFKISYTLASSEASVSSGQNLGSREVRTLSSGEASSATTSFPAGSFPKGAYVVWARVDAEKAVLDMNRTNNEFRGNEIKIGPDMIISTVAATLLPSGEQVEIQDTIKNQGNQPAGDSFQVSFYLSPDDRLDDSDRWVGSRRINGLEVGVASTGKTLVSLPPRAEPGGTFVLARVDPEGTIGEIQTGNNTATAGRLLKTDVDLMVSQLTATLTPNGNQMMLTDTVKNLGPDAIPLEFSVAFYLSRDGVIDSGDLLLGERHVEGLKAGMSSSGTTTLFVPLEAGAGKLSILARVDSRTQVMERKETNNDYWGSSIHLGPDLVLTELKSEVASDAHEVVVVQIIKNQGNRATPAGFKIAVYLSKDTRISSDDVLLGKPIVAFLVPGAESTSRSAFPTPSSLENGKYILLGQADPDQEVIEVEEANNDRAGEEFFLGPDLVVEAIQSTLLPEGDRITVEDTVRNQGNRPASGNLEVSYFLSRNWSIDDSDILLGSRTLSRLGPDEPSTASTALSIPKKKVTTGRYFVLARVDGGSRVIETNETNNVRPTLVPLIIRQEKKKQSSPFSP